MKFSRIGGVLLASSSFAMLSTACLAQGQVPAQPIEEAALTEDEEPVITVTGSRVVRDGNSSPSPVTVVATDTLLTVQPGANLADALNVLPVFSGSRGTGSNPSTGGSASGGNGAANQLNLRNLGITRTLVLMDGLRIPPTLFNGAVDVDLIPQMLVQRVDVVTGGVSAVYGSDAVSGVVNYILDHDFTGLKFQASQGISEYSDARQRDFGIAWGTDLGERAHFEASYQYQDSEGILRRSDRPHLYLAGVAGAGTEENPFAVYSGLRQRDFPASGIVTTGPLAGQVFREDGSLSPFVAGQPTGTAALQIGGEGGTWDSSLLQPLEAHQLFARFDFDFSDAVSFHVQASDNIKTNENFAEYLRYNNVVLRTDNPFLSAAQQSALAAGGPTFRFRKTLSEGEDRRQNSLSDSNQWMINAGFSGTISDYDWQVDYIRGRTVLKTLVRNNINQQNLAAALDAVLDPSTGQVVCAATLTNPGAYGDCVPLNPFGPRAESTAALDYVFGETNYRAVTTTDNFSGSIAGSPFDTWAGPLTAAISGEWRKIAFRSTSDATSDDVVDCSGLRYNCTEGQSEYFLTLSGNPRVSQTVWEVAGEVNVPLLRDSAIGDALDINGAVRYTSYNTSGEYVTWKLGLDWNLSDTLRFRGTWSRDIRAPTLYELFAESFVVNISPTDLLTGLSPVIQSLNGSNPDLTAEIGKTITGGFVWQPTSSLSITLDGYRIEVSDAIEQVVGNDPVFQRACYESGGTSPYCQLQTRPGSFTDTSPANAWTGTSSILVNISSIRTWGTDLEVGYNDELFNRPFSARVLAAYQPELSFRQPNIGVTEQAGAAFGATGFAATPTVRVTGFVHFEPTDNFSVDIIQRWRNKLKISNEGVLGDGATLEPFATTGVNLAYTVEDPRYGDFQVFLNVQNIFDEQPPIGGFVNNGTRAGLRDGYAIGDDIRGRFWTVGLRGSF